MGAHHCKTINSSHRRPLITLGPVVAENPSSNNQPDSSGRKATQFTATSADIQKTVAPVTIPRPRTMPDKREQKPSYGYGQPKPNTERRH